MLSAARSTFLRVIKQREFILSCTTGNPSAGLINSGVQGCHWGPRLSISLHSPILGFCPKMGHLMFAKMVPWLQALCLHTTAKCRKEISLYGSLLTSKLSQKTSVDFSGRTSAAREQVHALACTEGWEVVYLAF